MIKKIFNFKFSIINSSRGFTILESIVAIFILSLSISGAFSAVVQGLFQTGVAKDEVKAFYLAQEAVEIIRNRRDTNQLAIINGSPNTWLYNIAGDPSYPCDFNKICRVSATSVSWVRCGDTWETETCPPLKQDTSNFLYNYSSGDDTNFKREIQIESVSADEIAVTVRIKWKRGVMDREFKVKTHLFNWI